METRIRKGMAAIMVLCMMLMMLPMSVFAATIVNVGSQSETITAATAAQSATFGVTTDAADDQAVTIAWFTTITGDVIGSAPTGITANGSNVSLDVSTITVNGDNTTTAGDYYFKVTIEGFVSSVITLTVAPPTAVTAVADGIATATGTTTITLGQAITGLATGDIVVKKDGTPLTDVTNYALTDLAGTSVAIAFYASAGLTSASVVTVEMTKATYLINGGAPIAVTNTIPVPATLSSIAITTQATKLAYTVGDTLDITGMVVTGTYSDSSKQVETITAADVTGFGSSAPTASQILTVTVNGKIATYTISIAPAYSLTYTAVSAIGSFKTTTVTVTTGTALALKDARLLVVGECTGGGQACWVIDLATNNGDGQSTEISVTAGSFASVKVYLINSAPNWTAPFTGVKANILTINLQ